MRRGDITDSGFGGLGRSFHAWSWWGGDDFYYRVRRKTRIDAPAVRVYNENNIPRRHEGKVGVDFSREGAKPRRKMMRTVCANLPSRLRGFA